VLTETYLSTSSTGSARLSLTKPLLIYSRLELNGMLLKRAEVAGAEIEKARVLKIERRCQGWALKTKSGTIDADYCVIATGARNPLRDVGTRLGVHDSMVALGYYVPTEQEHIDIQFFRGFEGYIWVFPRHGHLSVGICGKGETAQAMRARLERYMNERGIAIKGSKFYGHVIPSLERPAWRDNRVAGDGWMAVGDAAGLVDPITGEGLYYAIRSGDLAADVILADAHAHSELAQAYRTTLHRDFTEDLELASRIAKRIFLGRFLLGTVPERMIQFMRRSPTFCELLQDVFAGTQNYLDLKARLLRNLNGTFHEALMNVCLRRLVPGTSRV
jgi:flavin-dependent dehydrogenase